MFWPRTLPSGTGSQPSAKCANGPDVKVCVVILSPLKGIGAKRRHIDRMHEQLLAGRVPKKRYAGIKHSAIRAIPTNKWHKRENSVVADPFP